MHIWTYVYLHIYMCIYIYIYIYQTHILLKIKTQNLFAYKYSSVTFSFIWQWHFSCHDFTHKSPWIFLGVLWFSIVLDSLVEFKHWLDDRYLSYCLLDRALNEAFLCQFQLRLSSLQIKQKVPTAPTIWSDLELLGGTCRRVLCKLVGDLKSSSILRYKITEVYIIEK